MRIAHGRGEPGTFVVELCAMLDFYLCLMSKGKFCHVKYWIRCKVNSMFQC